MITAILLTAFGAFNHYAWTPLFASFKKSATPTVWVRLTRYAIGAVMITVGGVFARHGWKVGTAEAEKDLKDSAFAVLFIGIGVVLGYASRWVRGVSTE